MASKLQIRQAFITTGFRVTAKRGDPCCVVFKKRYNIEGHEFEVSCDVSDMTLTTLPTVYLTKKPDVYEGMAIPHVDVDESICYVDGDRASWDPNDAVATIQLVDNQLSDTFKRVVNQDGWKDEYAGEFANYWRGTKSYLISSGKGLLYFAHKTGRNNEYVIGDAEDFKQWRRIRPIGKQVVKGCVVEVGVKESRIRPGMIWPVDNLKHLFLWLVSFEPNTLDYLCRSIVAVIKGKNSSPNIVLLLNTPDGHIGCEIRLNDTVYQSLKKSRPNIKLTILRAQLERSVSVKSFIRLNVSLATDDYIVTRNRPKDGDLRGKKIALIGAGNIGGYVAHQLVQIGAGLSIGENAGVLDIFDGDCLGAHNLGRHSLGAKYLGWNKAFALVDVLSSMTVHTLKLNSYGHFDFQSTTYDLIINATGHDPLGLKLAYWIRHEYPEYLKHKRPVLVNGWIDAHGLATRVLIDNGDICYACLRDENGRERLPLYRNGQEPQDGYQFNRRCGASYTPYDSAVSLSAASLLQQAVLESITTNAWNFAQNEMSSSIIHRGYKKLQPNKYCSICGRGHDA